MPHDHPHHDNHLDPMDARVRALETILTRKGLVDPAAIDAIIDTYAHKVGPQNGAAVVARAWTDPAFAGWGRCPCDQTSGQYRFDTIRPGRVPFPDGRIQAPHVTFWVVARGINIGLHTRMYFPDEEVANGTDPVLARIEHKVRIPTLIASSVGKGAYQFDIRLQGDDETIFFDI